MRTSATLFFTWDLNFCIADLRYRAKAAPIEAVELREDERFNGWELFNLGCILDKLLLEGEVPLFSQPAPLSKKDTTKTVDNRLRR